MLRNSNRGTTLRISEFFNTLSLLMMLGFLCVSTHAQPLAMLDNERLSLSATKADADPKVAVFNSLKEAWRLAEQNNKVVMMVLGSESCDRCVLLDRYLDDESLSARIEKHFVRVDISTTAFQQGMSVQIDDEQLPAIILIESEGPFTGRLPSERLMTFRPEVYEPMYDWMENLLFYSDQVFASYSSSDISEGS